MATQTNLPSGDDSQVFVGNDPIPGTTQQEEPAAVTPSVTPAPAAQPEPAAGGVPPEAESEGAPGTPSQEPEPGKPRTISPTQKRINELTRKRYELEAKVEELNARLEGRARVTGEGTVPPAGTQLTKPVRDNYETYEDWVEAVSLYSAKRALDESKVQETKAREAEQQKQIVSAWNSRVEQARTKYEDFDDVVSSDLQIPQAAFNAIVDSPHGPDIAYYIGSNPDTAK
jgi:hypothetical protein